MLKVSFFGEDGKEGGEDRGIVFKEGGGLSEFF